MIDENKLIKEIRNMVLPLTIPEIDDGTTLAYNEALVDVLNAIEEQPKVGKWIPVEEGLPKEYESIFAKYKGTKKWYVGMFEKISSKVNVAIQYEDGKTKSDTSYTIDGKWKIEDESFMIDARVIAWMPLPEPYVKGE